jgi:hypothetical protein
VPLPRRTALVPLLDDVVVVVDPPPRDVALEPDEDEPLDDDPEPEPDELEPLDGGADRTGCCSEYEGAVYDGAVYEGAETGAGGGDDSRGIACVALGAGAAGGGADSVAGGADLGMVWAAAGCGASSSATVPPAAKVSIKLVCVRISLPPEPYSATLLPSFNGA